MRSMCRRCEPFHKIGIEIGKAETYVIHFSNRHIMAFITNLVATLVGAAISLVTQLVTQTRAERPVQKRELRSQVLQAYIDLGTLVSSDLERAKNAEAALVRRGPERDDEQTRGWYARWDELEKQRHSLRERIAQAVFKCHLLEASGPLKEKLKALPAKQPVIAPFDGLNGPDFPEHKRKYEQQVSEYDKAVTDLRDTVCREYVSA
jgi:hypothetical protein